jgi:hypothetical protein
MPYKPSLEPRTTAGAVVRIYNGIPDGVSPAIGIPGMPGTSDITRLYGISCSSTTSCVAAGWDFFLAAVVVPIGDFGPGTVTNVSPGSLSGIECEQKHWCIADGENNGDGSPTGGAIYLKGRNLKYENSAGNASISNLAAGACQQHSISLTCITAGTAVAGGGVIYPIVDQLGGAVLDIAGTYELDGVSCGGTHSCVAVGQSSSAEGALVEILGETPETVMPVSGTTEFSSVSCASATFCMAVGSNSSSRGVAYTFSLRS